MDVDKIKGGLHSNHFGVNRTKMTIEDSKKAWKKYKKRVQDLTEKVKHQIPNIETRGFTTFHIDHKISIWYGFNNDIPPELIAGIDNLRMITAEENCAKGTKCHT